MEGEGGGVAELSRQTLTLVNNAGRRLPGVLWPGLNGRAGL